MNGYTLDYNASKKDIPFKQRFSLGVALGIDLFAIFSLAKNIKMASLDEKQAFYEKNYNKQHRSQKLENLLEKYKNDYDDYILLKDNFDKNVILFKSLEKQYELKKISLLDLKIAQKNLSNVRIILLKKSYTLKLLEIEIVVLSEKLHENGILILL